MRTRLLLRGVAVALLAVLAFSAPAAAVEDPNEECLHILEEGGEVDDCQEAPNPILPETNEIIWGGLAFLVLLVLLAKFAYPPLKQGLNDRAEKIRDEVEQAERIRAEAAAEESAREDALKQARHEATELVEAARQEAEQYRAAERAKVDEDIAALRAQAQADAEASKQQAMAELRGEVVALAIGAAEEVVGRNLNDDANRALVESFIDRVGSGDG